MRKDSKDMVGVSKEFSSSSSCSGSGLSLFSLPENSHRVRNVFGPLWKVLLFLPILYTTKAIHVKGKIKVNLLSNQWPIKIPNAYHH